MLLLQNKKPTWGITKYQAHPLAKDEEKLKPRLPDSCSSALYPWVQAEAALPVVASNILITPYIPHPLHFISILLHGEEHSFCRSTFILCKIYWML